MDLLKTPHQMLMEKAGLSPSSPGMVNTPEQMSMQEARVLPHFAAGGSEHAHQMGAQDMLAFLVANGHLPEHFKTGGHALSKLITEMKHHPEKGLYNLFGASDIIGQGIDAAKHAAAGRTPEALESGFGALVGLPAAMPSVPVAASLAVPYAGQGITYGATNSMAANPAFRQQMNDMSNSPLGGALGGDSALASQIMGNKDYSGVLEDRNPPTPEEAPAAAKPRSLLYQKTMGFNK